MPQLNRRNFTAKAAMSGLFTIVPRHVLGGPGHVAPSDKLTLAHIGMGTQSFRELGQLLATPQLQIVAVCDPNTNSSDYLDWSKGGIRNTIRKILGNPTWRENDNGCPGGREVGQEVIDTYYAKQRGAEKFKACKGYADFRELLEKEKDVDIVKIMTPDHLHATIAIAAMKKGKHVVMHKPLANRMYESRLVVETARKTKVATHLLAYGSGAPNARIAEAIKQGVIGRLREIHNWSNRPVWPQYPEIPKERPPVPKGFHWDLWLGPSPDRPYHPYYTHTTFRGWYEFGGGAIADMGIYSLWPVISGLNLGSPISAEAWGTHTCTVVDLVSRPLRNDVSFPAACMIRFQFAPQNGQPAPELFWYDGGIKPRVPDELTADDRGLNPEGILFIGDEGKIIADFRGHNAQLVKGGRRTPLFEDSPRRERSGEQVPPSWLAAFQGGAESPGSFLNAGPINELVNLGAVALRARRKVLFDSANVKITNSAEANQFLYREYRRGWELSEAASG